MKLTYAALNLHIQTVLQMNAAFVNYFRDVLYSLMVWLSGEQNGWPSS